jgi:hypothetical protein
MDQDGSRSGRFIVRITSGDHSGRYVSQFYKSADTSEGSERPRSYTVGRKHKYLACDDRESSGCCFDDVEADMVKEHLKKDGIDVEIIELTEREAWEYAII